MITRRSRPGGLWWWLLFFLCRSSAPSTIMAAARPPPQRQAMARETETPTHSPTVSPTSFPTTKSGKWTAVTETEEEEEYVGGEFCAQASDKDDHDWNEWDLCRAQEETWETLVTQHADMTFYQRPWTGECGPTCRPSCVTLLLDLTKLDYANDLKCRADELCQCRLQKNRPCASETLEALWDEHPKCFLEDADCLGPTVYDDYVAYVQQKSFLDLPTTMERCAAIPKDNDELYCRFHDWKLVTPLTHDDCFDDAACMDPTKIYFEYCHVVEEDPSCERCDDEKCSKNCRKMVEPFPPGWTHFVVSAPIPYRVNEQEDCDDLLQYETDTYQACFLQRVEIYYPLLDEDCGLGCPHCHECPLLSLGDKFGPLEVVGFGHTIEQNFKHGEACVSCDQRDEKYCEDDLQCDALDRCEEMVDCYTGDSLNVPPFTQNQCSFCDDDGTELTVGGINAGEESMARASEEEGAVLPVVPVVAAVLIIAMLLMLMRRRRRRGARSRVAHKPPTPRRKGGAVDTAPDQDTDGSVSQDLVAYDSAVIMEASGSDAVETLHVTGRARVC